MSLKEYKAKRHFTETSEPKSSKKRQSGSLNFCVQKHAARRLHYDFRLEYKGVLLSWAIPKGPSLNPQDKRLAIKVEDHPIDYQHFEGTIPKGNYGAGTVEIWDAGTFITPKSNHPKQIEDEFTRGLKQGHLSFILHGKRLNGEFILQKLKKDEPDDNSWLLIKKPDAYQTNTDPIRIHKKSKGKMPDFFTPMLATLVDEPFDDDEWLFEIKWDGLRALTFIKNGKVDIRSRNNLSFNNRFPLIIQDLVRIKNNVILDGELVALDDKGKSHFQLIQNYQREESSLCYYVFDLPFKDGEDLRDLPLIERKNLLKNFLEQLNLPYVQFTDHILKEGKSFFKLAAKEKLEGIIGKKITSTYESRRSPDWVKIKTHLRQEVIICGFTEPKGSRKKFGALIVGIFNKNKELTYVGHVGGGFDAYLLTQVYDELRSLITNKCPFKQEPKVNSPVTWVRPKLIAEVSFAEWTKDNNMRQPIFQGLRDDKKPQDIKQEIPKISPPSQSIKGSSKNLKDLSLTHLDKVYWPKEGYTKGDLIKYYEKVAPYILPYLKDRPIMLHRYPEGIEGKDFYQKDLNFNPPDWIKTFLLEQEGKINNYLLIDDVRSLLYAINLGSIDLHPFLSRIASLHHPDFCVIDIDPHDVTFDAVIEVTHALHDLLEKANIDHYCKTSGGKGLHIMIPLHAKYDYSQSRQFAEIIGYLVHKKFPKITSLERSPEKRPKKIYVDCLQNRISQSLVAPYSVRPRQNAAVSTPLEWKEVNSKLDLSAFNIQTVPNRLKKMGDILKPILGKGINLKKSLEALEAAKRLS